MTVNKDYHTLNAMLNLLGEDGKVQFEKDKQAVRSYFLNHVNANTWFFHSLEEKLNYLVENEYYDQSVLDKYTPEFIKSIYKRAYGYKFRFSTFVGAYKYYTTYTLKTKDGSKYLERYEDRVSITALYLAEGNENLAVDILDEMMTGRYQPATPTFLNAGRKQRGELVSCFLLNMNDTMEGISRSINAALQLSKRGGGVAFNMSNLRESGAPIKNMMGQGSGVIPVMKLFEDSFSYANQLGQRSGAGAVYLNAHHPDIMRFLDTKRENADEKIRIKTLSLGVVVPNITFELARKNEDMYLFSPYDIKKVYGKDMSHVSITEMYYTFVNDSRITKKKINAREFFQTLAEIQFESGYPYIVFEDTVNEANPIAGHINMSNLCTEILQVNELSEFNEDLSYSYVGKDISCNLGSINIALAMDGKSISETVSTAVRALTAVSDMSNIDCVPSIKKGNAESHAIGLGQMNLHGFLAREGIHYGSPESIEFTDLYFKTINYHAITESCNIARERGQTFKGFSESKYASGEYFDMYIVDDEPIEHNVVRELFEKYNFTVPTLKDWQALCQDVKEYGMYNQNLQAIPPTGSISYINNSTSSIHPIASKIEIRKEGKLGRVYYPAPFMNNENMQYYKDAYEVGAEKIIDVYAAATKHVDQGLSLTLFFKDTATTRDINKAQIYAFKKKIKTIYYMRVRQAALEGTEVAGCVSCSL